MVSRLLVDLLVSEQGLIKRLIRALSKGRFMLQEFPFQLLPNELPNNMSPECDESVDQEAFVQVSGLTKRYGDFCALRECTLSVRKGVVFGLLGPNGAGKTTLLRLLLGYLFPTSGKATIDGLDVTHESVAVRRLVSYLPGDARLPRHMRGRSVLEFFAEMQPEGDLSRSLAIADQLELDLRRRVAFMSTGMRQKLALAVVMGARTPLLILDEPTANLDPSVRTTILRMVAEAQSEGRTIIFSSHVLAEIEEVCNRVIFLRQGIVARHQRMDALKQRHRIVAQLDVAPPAPEPSSASSSQPLGSESPGAVKQAHAASGELPFEIPVSLRALVEVSTFTPPAEPRTLWVRMDTAGDLSPLLGWLDSLRLRRMRVEPLGLRAIYDEVHHLKTADDKHAAALGASA